MATELSTREAYGQTLQKLGKERKDIIVLDADLSKSTMTNLFAKAFPDRFFDCGIAEQNMMDIAAGLASCGKTVFASTFAVFAGGRCFDQVRMCIAQPQHNVKIVASHGGVSVGQDGMSHQSIEDLALMTIFPGMTVIVPADALEAAQAVETAAATPGPFYIRMGRPKVPQVCPDDYRFALGKAATMRPGKDVTIIAMGIMVASAIKAAQKLAGEGIDCRVLNMATLKPIDREAIILAAQETRGIVSAEEHLKHGGLGSAIAEILVEAHPARMVSIGLHDRFAESGNPDELLKKYGLASEDIEGAVRKIMERRGQS
ncbi:MAG: transketolase family protein [Dehalococcoidia bacterium]|nr:transketolase family protein [Dehalococcoidia bacterium]